MGRVTLSFPNPDTLWFLTEIEVDNIPAVKARLQKEGKPVPDPIRTLALVDTGASVCAATAEFIRRLRLPTRSSQDTEVVTAGGVIKSKIYFGAFHLLTDKEISVDYVTINRFDFTGVPFSFIIGMNALVRWHWSYSKVDQKLTIQHPD